MSNKPTYRMSHIGSCARALSAERLGYPSKPAPDWLERAAEEGKRHELWIKEQLVAEGYEVLDDQLELELDYPNFKLVGHIDGKVRKDGVLQLLEIKSMSQYEFDRWMKGRFDEFPTYAAQITCYLTASGLNEFLYLCKNRSSGYIDRNVVVGMPTNYNNILNKVSHIEECVAIGTLVDINYDPDSIECRRCSYKDLCVPEPQVFTAVPESKLLEASENWRKGKALEQEAKTLVNTAKEVFLNQTEASGQKKWRFNELAIVKVEVGEQTTYPKKKLLQVFTEEELGFAKEVKLPYSYIKINDLQGEER